MNSIDAAAPMTLTIGRREFSLSVEDHGEGPRYVLTGKRGAQYKTMRNAKRPEVMFLVDARGFGLAAGYERVRLTDAGGALRVVAA